MTPRGRTGKGPGPSFPLRMSTNYGEEVGFSSVPKGLGETEAAGVGANGEDLERDAERRRETPSGVTRNQRALSGNSAERTELGQEENARRAGCRLGGLQADSSCCNPEASEHY